MGMWWLKFTSCSERPTGDPDPSDLIVAMQCDVWSTGLDATDLLGRVISMGVLLGLTSCMRSQQISNNPSGTKFFLAGK